MASSDAQAVRDTMESLTEGLMRIRTWERPKTNKHQTKEHQHR